MLEQPLHDRQCRMVVVGLVAQINTEITNQAGTHAVEFDIARHADQGSKCTMHFPNRRSRLSAEARLSEARAGLGMATVGIRYGLAEWRE